MHIMHAYVLVGVPEDSLNLDYMIVISRARILVLQKKEEKAIVLLQLSSCTYSITSLGMNQDATMATNAPSIVKTP